MDTKDLRAFLRVYEEKSVNKAAKQLFIPASNEPSGCLQTFGDCREGQRPRCSAALQV